MSIVKTPPAPAGEPPVPVEPAALSALDQARADVDAATAALEAGRAAHAVAHAAVAEVVAKATALDPHIAGSDLTAARGELDLAAHRMPLLQAQATEAQVALTRAQAEVILQEFTAWHAGGSEAVLAKAEAAKAALLEFINETSAFNDHLLGVRRRLDATHDPLSRLVLDANGRFRLDGKFIDYSTPAEWTCRLAGAALKAIPTGEGSRIGGDLLAEGRVVSPVPADERPDDGTGWRPVQPNLPVWMAAQLGGVR